MNLLFKCFLRITIIAVAFLVGCKKNEPVDLHYDYFPMDEGRFITYSVREINIDYALGLNDTLNYYVKTKIGDTITDNEGRVARRYERYFRDSLTQPWALQDSWTCIIASGRAELVEENQRTIKMVFTPDKYKEWNCNAYNSFDALDCYYRDLHEPASINGFSFASTMTVEQEDFHPILYFYRRKYEQYAKGVGMYYKHYKDFRLFGNDTLDVKKGKELIMRLIDYGTE
ncbi:MAG: hypothetical protein QE487_15375 [Fluviicola sp.]|nr:hypothetical protein [Fluviicola sp.]